MHFTQEQHRQLYGIQEMDLLLSVTHSHPTVHGDENRCRVYRVEKVLTGEGHDLPDYDVRLLRQAVSPGVQNAYYLFGNNCVTWEQIEGAEPEELKLMSVDTDTGRRT